LCEYENRVFRHNDFDAVYRVLAYASKLKGNFKDIVLISKKSGVEVNTISLSLTALKDYLEDSSLQNRDYLKESIKNISLNGYKGKLLASGCKSERLKPHLELTPVLKTMVGTEVGLIDYQLLLGATAKINLSAGLDLTARYDFHIDHSNEFDSSKMGVFAYLYNKGGLNSAMLHYTDNFKGFVNTFSSGVYKYEYVGVADQLTYVYDNHIFSFKAGYFKHFGDYEHIDREETKKFALGKYTYLYQPLDLQLSIQAGRYWKEDDGFDIELKKFFGDVAVSIKYLQTSPKDNGGLSWAESSNKYIGLYVEMPLDFKKSKTNWKYLQVEGDNAWKHGLRSTVARADGTNTITPGSGEEPMFNIEHRKDFFNRDRVGAGYLKNHLDMF